MRWRLRTKDGKDVTARVANGNLETESTELLDYVNNLVENSRKIPVGEAGFGNYRTANLDDAETAFATVCWAILNLKMDVLSRPLDPYFTRRGETEKALQDWLGK
jgi:hypothetical protein